MERPQGSECLLLVQQRFTGSRAKGQVLPRSATRAWSLPNHSMLAASPSFPKLKSPGSDPSLASRPICPP